MYKSAVVILGLIDITVTCHAMSLTIIGSDRVLERPGIMTACVSENVTVSFLAAKVAQIACNMLVCMVALSHDRPIISEMVHDKDIATMED